MPPPAAAAIGAGNESLASPAGQPGTRMGRARIDGLDVARAIAILGMFAAHIGRSSPEAGAGWLSVAHGRPSALFAILAGVSISLMLTRRAGTPGDLAAASAVFHTRWRVGVRGLILLPLGYLMAAFGTPVDVILANLGVMFVLSLVAFRWRPWGLWLGAALCIALGQIAVLNVTPALARWGVYELPVIEKLWSTHYPAVSWMGYILAGMAIGRLTLTSRRVQVVMAVVGAGALAVAEGVRVIAGGLEATWDSPWLSTVPHSYTPLEMAGNLASACLVIAVCLWLGQVARAVVWPFMAAGSMALTLYVAHIVVIAAVGDEIVYEASNVALLALAASALALASLWRWLVGQGPLERLMSAVSMAAANAAASRPRSAPRPQPDRAP